MDGAERTNRIIATVGWGILLIWWGISIAVDPITVGMSAVGTGLIMLGVNATRYLNGIPTLGSTTVIGSVALLWGALDTALSLQFGASFAVLLMVIGVIMIASILPRLRTA